MSVNATAAGLGAALVALTVMVGMPADAQVPTRDVPGSPGDRPTPSDPPDATPPSSGSDGRRGRSGMSGSSSTDRTRTTGWQLCNLSSKGLIHAVAVWSDGTAWQTSGWIPINQGKCRPAPVTRGTAYHFAVGDGQSWSGNSRFCLSPSTALARPGTACAGSERAVGFRKTTLRGGLLHTNFR